MWRQNIYDQGLTVLLSLLQSQFNMNFNISNYATTFKSAIYKTYKHVDEQTLKDDVIAEIIYTKHITK